MNKTSRNRINTKQETFQRIPPLRTESADDLSFITRSEVQSNSEIQDVKFLTLETKRSCFGDGKQTSQTQNAAKKKDDAKNLPQKPLNIAVLDGNMRTVLKLLDSGADPEEKDGFYGNTGVHWAIKADNVQVLELYKKRGFDLTLGNNIGWAPIHIAAEGSRCKTLLWLLNNGVDVESRDSLGQTPLFKAAFKGYLTATKILLSYGASPEIKDERSQTPLNKAVLGGNLEIVKLFIEHGADLKYIDSWGRNLLHFAKTLPVLEWLIGHNLDVNRKDDWGRTPLHDAVYASNLENASFLLEKGATVDAQDRNGCTPFYEAAKTGKAELVRLFLDYGADSEMMARDGSISAEVTSDETIKNLLFQQKKSF